MSDVKRRGIVSFLYNHNPFYLISAAITLYGFQASVQESGFANNPWLLASLFAGYTLILAFTAWFIVRFGKVWDDARSIFLVLFLLFMALSTSLDGVFDSDPTTAWLLSIAGFTFAVAITESIIFSLGIHFRALFRLPLYAMLAISFFYPGLLSVQQHYWPELDSRSVILFFPVLVSLAILSLIPATRRTRIYASKNGTPWKWPLYPYSIFVLAVVGLIGRTILLGLSFDPTPANGLLGTWIFVPIFLSIVWVLFEIGTIERNENLLLCTLFLTPGAIALACPWPLFPNTEFYELFSSKFGSPIWLTMIAVVMFYFISWIECVKGSGIFLIVSLIAVSLISSDSSLVQQFSDVQSWPFLILGFWSICSSERVRKSGNWFMTCCCLSFAFGNQFATIFTGNVDAIAIVTGSEIFFAFNFLLLTTCVIVCMFDDKFARRLKLLLGITLPTVASFAAICGFAENQNATFPSIYGCLLTFLCGSIFVALRSRLLLIAASISAFASFIAATPMMRISVGLEDKRLATFVLGGLGCFCAGLFVSALKAGWTRNFSRSFTAVKLEIVEAFAGATSSPTPGRRSGPPSN